MPGIGAHFGMCEKLLADGAEEPCLLDVYLLTGYNAGILLLRHDGQPPTVVTVVLSAGNAEERR